MIEAILNSHSQARRENRLPGLPSKTSGYGREKRAFFKLITNSRCSRRAGRIRKSQSGSSQSHLLLAMSFCLGPTALTESKWSSIGDKCVKAWSIGILQER